MAKEQSSDMQTEKEDEDDGACDGEYVALSDFTGSGSDQVRDTDQINGNRITNERGSALIMSLFPQLSFNAGDKLLVRTKPSPEWWWAELQGVTGYVPASYLRLEAAEEEEDTSLDDPWQDEEYFGSYGTLVRTFKEP